ncbi:Hsp70 family protein [Dactylosporangium sp. NPDC000244]|uniref:Hsp70 family protein n=1 Tax=Dactylosporangium sp. NPDC000244 TaxID=3154365 RepID=UPI00332A6692
MPPTGQRLGIDFGTSSTVAVLSWPDGRIKPLLFDGTPLLPSAVHAGSAAGHPVRLLVGGDAVHAAAAEPERYEPHPKRRIDEETLLLGDTEVPLIDCVAAILDRVAAEARRVVGGEPAGTVVTCPAGWGPHRRRTLAAAAHAAGLPDVRMVPEPVAAAAYFVDVVEGAVPDGAPIVVYDFGAGTFDASVVRRRADGFDVLATKGLDDTGGLDIDAAIVAHFGTVYAASRPELWQRLTAPRTAADRRAARQLWDHVRGAKERLSRLSTTVVHLPLLELDAPLGREQLDRLARSVVDRTLDATRAALRDAGVGPAELAAVFLVGGSSRLPLAATALHRGLGVAPTVNEQPELVVAEGSLCVPRDETTDEAAAPVPPPPSPRTATPEPAAPGAGPATAPTASPRARARTALLALALLAVGGGLWAWLDPSWRSPGASPGPSGSAAVASGPASSGNPPAAAAGSPSASVTPPCADSDLNLMAAPQQQSVARGAPLTLLHMVANLSTRDCIRDLGDAYREVYLQAGAVKVYSSVACAPQNGGEPTVLKRSEQVEHHIVWDGKATSAGCDDRKPPPAGTYQLFARLGTKLSTPVTVQIT